MTSAWIEVNLSPPSWNRPERLLVDVVDPLIHQQLAGAVDVWFYFWESLPEPALRLRIGWRDPDEQEIRRDELRGLLDAEVAAGRLAAWYEGNHGRRGETYHGEADTYGHEVWDLVTRDWTAGSELALALVGFDALDELARTRGYHWQRRVHLFSNQLLRDEVPLCLEQARGYLRMRGESDDLAAALIDAIGAYLDRPG